MDADTFFKYYRKYILVVPKIILLGNAKKSDTYTINKLLSRGTSARAIAKNAKELLDKDK